MAQIEEEDRRGIPRRLIATMNDDSLLDKETEEFEAVLKEFQASAKAAVERPDSFWTSQRSAVLDRIAAKRTVVAWKPIIAWGATLFVLVTAVGLWFGRARALPATDFVAGYDQDLLLDVQRLTKVDTSLALEPAQLLVGEIKRVR